MKTRRLLPLLLACLLALTLAPAAHAAPSPDPSALGLALVGTPYEAYTLSCQTFDTQYGEKDKGTAYAIASLDGKSLLCAFEEQQGGWRLCVANENCLPPDAGGFDIQMDEQAPLVIIRAQAPDREIQLRFIVRGTAMAHDTWPLFEVMVTVPMPEGQNPSVTQIAPSEETGKWTVTENGDYKAYENRAYATMEDLDLGNFPLTKAAADALWYGIGTLVYMEREDGDVNANLSKLVGRPVTLSVSQTIKVYSGPGFHYQRGAEGKASVSTKEPLTVYAADRDWVLISYGVASGERFGYIPRGYLPASLSLDHEIYQGSWSVGLTTREVALLDNLSEPDKPLRVLPYSSPLEVLAILGDWLYVECGSSGADSPCRGFIPADSLHHTNNF